MADVVEHVVPFPPGVVVRRFALRHEAITLEMIAEQLHLLEGPAVDAGAVGTGDGAAEDHDAVVYACTGREAHVGIDRDERACNASRDRQGAVEYRDVARNHEGSGHVERAIDAAAGGRVVQIDRPLCRW